VEEGRGKRMKNVIDNGYSTVGSDLFWGVGSCRVLDII
jgi:hypothetical protein